MVFWRFTHGTGKSFHFSGTPGLGEEFVRGNSEIGKKVQDVFEPFSVPYGKNLLSIYLQWGPSVGAPAPKLTLPRPARPTTSLVHHLVRGNEEEDMVAAAAAPTDDLQRRGTATDAGLLIVCPECSVAFGSARGRSQHRRRAHPTEYHAENVSTVR